MAPHAAVEIDGLSAAAPYRALERLLDDLAALLLEMPPDVYTATPVPGVSGSIGGHVRHILDHVSALAAARPSAPLSYDRRERGTAIETDPGAALRTMLRLKAALDEPGVDTLARRVLVTAQLTPGGDLVAGWSTLAREMAFVVGHTVHHQALIALLMAWQGLRPPDWFGYSPSTPRSAAV